MKINGFSCLPFTKMISKNFVDAKLECEGNPSCSMFFDECGRGTDWSYCMHTGVTEVTEYKILHKKGIFDLQ